MYLFYFILFFGKVNECLIFITEFHLIVRRKNKFAYLLMVIKCSLCLVRWESQGYFRPHHDQDTVPFVISMPPPNVTGSLHMGHAMFVTLEVVKLRASW